MRLIFKNYLGGTAMSVQTQKSGFSQYIHYIITAIIIFGFRFLPNFGPVTDEGMVL